MFIKEGQKMQGKLNSPKTATCPYCKKEFVKETPTQKYCKSGHTTNCEYCGKEIPFTCSPAERPRYCSKECREASKKQHLMQKYGVDNVSKLDKVKKKISQANSSEAVKDKRKTTCLQKYGVDNPAKSEEVKDRIKTVFLEKYGETNAMKIQKFKEKFDWNSVVSKRKNTMIAKYGVDYSFDIPEVKERFVAHNVEKFGVPYYVMTKEYRNPSTSNVISKTNLSFSKLLSANGIKHQLEFPVGNKVYDVWVEDSKILIEIDPTYTHNSFGNHWNKGGLSPSYHVDKSRNALDHGYHCIHIFDWDNVEKVIEIVNQKDSVIYGRQCTLAEIDDYRTKEFETTYHLQGYCRGQTIKIGLHKDGELVEMMTFGQPRYNKKYDWELLRLCTKSNIKVIGGASRLFSYFIKQYNPASIISYCDKSKFEGTVYTKLGMKLNHSTNPAKIWSLGDMKITDNLLRQRGYDQLFNTNFGKGVSNEELMLENGWLPVYDCGQDVYVWENAIK